MKKNYKTPVVEQYPVCLATAVCSGAQQLNAPDNNQTDDPVNAF